MKKGLLTLLAASLVFVGCQNYDDQFDDLNAQISALKSQVDGLASLSGQVASLSGSISGLQAGVNAAQSAASAASSAASAIDLTGLSASLATLQAEVDAVQASLATAATASAVTALQAEVAAIQSDVDELLATSNVYTKDLTISSAAGLDAAIALGNNINIINGTVTITQSTAMDATKLQSVIDKIFTVTGNYTYSASATTVTPMTFDNLASVADLTLTVNGPVSAKALVSAGTINLVSTYTSKVTGVDFSALTTVTNLETGGTDDTISFASATNVDLGSLANYPGVGSDYGLTISTKKDATLDISSLDDVSATGTATDVALIINGPKDVNISNITSYSGSISATNVENLTLNGFKGKITVNGGVENINITDAEQFVLSGADDLETVVLDVDVASDPDLSAALKAPGAYGGSIASYTGETPTLDFSSMSDLTSVTLTGSFLDVDFTSLSDLTTIDIEATMRDLTISNNDNLTSVDVTGSTIRNTNVTLNDGLTSLELDHTTGLAQVGGSTGTASTYATASITSNAELASLTFGASKIRNMTVTGNAKLATVDFTGWAGLGTSSTVDPTIAVYSNALVATKAQDTDDGTSQYSIDGTNDADDLGTYTTASGMETLSAPLLLYQADADADAAVHFDTVSIHTVDADAVDTENAGEQNSGNAILYSDQATSKTNWVGAVYLNTASDYLETNPTGYSAVKQKYAWLVDNTSATSLNLTIGGDSVFHDADGFGSVALTGINAADVSALLSSTATTRATDLGVTLNVEAQGSPTLPNITFLNSVTPTTGNNGENYTNSTALTLATLLGDSGGVVSAISSWDQITMSIGDASITATITSGVLTSTAAITNIASQLVSTWNTKYSTGSVSGVFSYWTTMSASAGVITAPTLKSSKSGTRAFDDVVSITFSPVSGKISIESSGVETKSRIAWTIGSSEATTDNGATANALVISVEEVVAGSGKAAANSASLATNLGTITETGVYSNTGMILTTNKIGFGTSSQNSISGLEATGIFPTDARGDVVTGQVAEEGLVVTSGSVRFTRSRIHWLGT
ncbi:MAG: hypothetical protein VW741_01705 [Flammeovirgaceae bacterium]